MPVNAHGLQREIPAEVKRLVRQRSKFGCVVCRNAIYEYEHIDPPFVECRSHDVENICLLCGSCHARVTRGHLSEETVKRRYREIAINASIRRPFSDFDLSAGLAEIGLGSCAFSQSRAIFTVDGVDVLAFDAPEDGIGPPKLSGIFCDENGKELFRIVRNEWLGSLEAWDIEVTGSLITVRTGRRRISLRIRLYPPNRIVIERLNMMIGEAGICIQKGVGLVVYRNFNGSSLAIGVDGLRCQGASSCVYVNTSKPILPTPIEVRMIGGGGIELFDTGVVMAKGSGGMTIPNLKIWA